MGVITTEQEISCSLISSKRLFKAFVFSDLMPKLIPQFFKSFEIVEGDGGVGSIKVVTYTDEAGMKPAKEKIEEVNEETGVYKYSVFEGVFEGLSLQDISIS